MGSGGRKGWARLAPDAPAHDGLLGVQAVFSLVENDRLRAVHDRVGYLFAAVGEEMGESLERSAFSPNIKERRDYSCALFDHEGRMIGQAAHLPVHLGAAPLSVAAARARVMT